MRVEGGLLRYARNDAGLFTVRHRIPSDGLAHQYPVAGRQCQVSNNQSAGLATGN